MADRARIALDQSRRHLRRSRRRPVRSPSSAAETTGGRDGRSTGRAARAIDRALVALVVVAAAYTLWRGFTLQVDYYDGYRYLANARRLLGDDQVSFDKIRPPLLALIQAPVVALARVGGPANPALVHGPHVLSALLSLLTALALFYLFEPACGRRAALFGTALFMSTRYFVRYGAHVMTDVATAGAAAAAVGWWTRARESHGLASYVVCGSALGCATAMKFSSVLLLPALAAAELILTPGSRTRGPTVTGRRWVGLALAGATAAALFVIVEGFALWRVYGTGAWGEFRAAIQGARGAVDAWPGESWRDYVPMLLTMVSPPVVMLAVTGMAIALWRPERRDAPFWTWLLLIGGSIVFFVGHNEARYLLPALPPFIYFAIRAVEPVTAFSQRPYARASTPGTSAVSLFAGFAVLVTVANGLAQAWSDQDPVFRRDVQRRAAALAAASLRDDGRLWILGKRHTLSTQDPGPVPQDEFWNTFHYERHVVEYFLGRSPRVLPVPNGTASTVTPRLATWVADGDAILRLDDQNYYTKAFPPGPIPRPLEVWSVRRMDFHATPDTPEMLVDGAGTSVRVEPGTNGGELLFTADRALGDFSAFVVMSDGAEPRFVGNVRLSAGVPTSVPASAGRMPASVVLLRVDVQKVGL